MWYINCINIKKFKKINFKYNIIFINDVERTMDNII